jgi:hypothetical protein
MSDACAHYARPKGVMGGPCLNCGRSQPEHVNRDKGPQVEDLIREISRRRAQSGARAQKRMNPELRNTVKLQELMTKHGFLPDESLLEFGELIVRECMKICQTAGDDLENDDMFLNKAPQLLNDLRNGHWGAASWYAAEEIKQHFGIDSHP